MGRNTSVKDMSAIIIFYGTQHFSKRHVYNNMGRNTSVKDMSTIIWDTTLQ